MPLSDLKDVDWGATAKLAVTRGFASAVVLTTAGLFIGAFSAPGGSGAGGALRFLLTWTFAGAVGAIVYIWILNAIDATLGRVVGIVTLVTALFRLIVAAMVAIGDPLVFAVNRRFPEFLDLAEFKIFNFVAVIFVRKHSLGR